ncbi:hypothetical protein M4K04_004431 [Escherichia coli]|nr:hypothetical protein [Escherichia coli]
MDSLHFATQSRDRLRRLQRPAALLYGLRPAPPFGRCTTHPPALPASGKGAVRHVAGVQVAAPLRSALPAPLPERWSFRQRQGHAPSGSLREP